MNLLLDTHFVVWMAVAQYKLSDRDRTIIAEPDATVHVSIVSIWEIRIKWNTRDRSGHRKGAITPDQAIKLVNDSGFTLVSLHPEDVRAPLDPPILHRDPFDEMLLVHAGRLNAQLLTRDKLLQHHPLVYHP